MTRLGFGGARADLLAQALASPGSSLYWNGTDGKPGRLNKRQYVSKMSSGGMHNFSLKARRFVSVGQSVCWESCWDFPRVEASAYPVYQWVQSAVHTHWVTLSSYQILQISHPLALLSFMHDLLLLQWLTHSLLLLSCGLAGCCQYELWVWGD